MAVSFPTQSFTGMEKDGVCVGEEEVGCWNKVTVQQRPEGCEGGQADISGKEAHRAANAHTDLEQEGV